MEYQNLEIEIQRNTATIWINRPQVRNALDETLIAELTHAFNEMQDRRDARVVILGGRGTAFSAGADLNWMKRMAGYSSEQNLADAMRLATMLRAVNASTKPVIARVHGPAFAGGMGLAAACDVVVADPAAEFCLTEVRIGLTPATISPYVLRALGVQACRRYMLTAERLKADEAARLGFVHELTGPGQIDEAVGRIASALRAGGPDAIAVTKKLIEQVGLRTVDTPLIQETASAIAQIRASREGREGVSSFLEKRKPSWVAVPSEGA